MRRESRGWTAVAAGAFDEAKARPSVRRPMPRSG